MFAKKRFYPLALLLFLTSFQRINRPNPTSEPNQVVANKVQQDEPIFLLVKAKEGDNLPSLLQRYDLYGFECNTRKFLQINKLTTGFKLKPGKEYNIPVQVVKYNGKSIRTTLDIKDLEVALRIDSYNKAAVTKKLRTDNFTESKNLWVPWHELNCNEGGEVGAAGASVEITPEKAYLGNREFPIFGKKYQKTPLIDRKMKGKVYYIVSGHGGPDGGAEGSRNGKTLFEDEYSYDVSLRLVRYLVSHGATAYMIVRDENDGIRDDAILEGDKDEVVWGNLAIPKPQKKRLFQRSDLINEMTKKNAKSGVTEQTLIEIHVDSRNKNAKTDVFFYYRSGSESSEKLARSFHQTFKHKYMKVRAGRLYGGTVNARDLHMLRETIVPTAVYIELGNIRNAYDQERLVRSENRQALANWLGEALLVNKR